MSKASAETFLRYLNTTKSNSDRARVYRYIRRNKNCHIETMRKDLKLSHQTLTARLSALMDMGLVYVSGTAKTITSTLSLFAVEENDTRIDINALNRRKEKFNKWKAKAKRFDDFLSDYTMEIILSA